MHAPAASGPLTVQTIERMEANMRTDYAHRRYDLQSDYDKHLRYIDMDFRDRLADLQTLKMLVIAQGKLTEEKQA